MSRTDRLLIRTPEGVAFSMALASPVVRLVAWAVDLACIVAAFQLVQILVSAFYLIGEGLATALLILVQFLVLMGYSIALEWLWRGQTLGKRLLRLRVMDEQGLRLSFSQVVIRNLLRAVDILPGLYFLGGVSCLLTARCQRLGDLAAGTVVVRSPRIYEPDLDKILPGKFNSFRDYPHLAARMRQRITPEETDIAVQALAKRHLLDPQARLVLFREIADHFRATVEFPQSATEGLSDEQYVRNLVDVLYRSPGKRSGG